MGITGRSEVLYSHQHLHKVTEKLAVYKLCGVLQYILCLMLSSKKKKKEKKNTLLYESWIATDSFCHCSEQYAKSWSKYRAAGKIKITGNIRSLEEESKRSPLPQGLSRPDTCKITGMPWNKPPLEQKHKSTWKPAKILPLSEGCVQHHLKVSFPFLNWKTGKVKLEA